MVFQTYAFIQSQDSHSGKDVRAERADGVTAIPLRCHRAMVPADIVVSAPLSVLGAMVMALLALPRKAMMAGAGMAPVGLRVRARHHRGA